MLSKKLAEKGPSRILAESICSMGHLQPVPQNKRDFSFLWQLAANAHVKNPAWILGRTFFRQPSGTRGSCLSRQQWLATFPCFPVLGKTAGKIANGRHMITANCHRCKWVAKCSDRNHVTMGLLQQLLTLGTESKVPGCICQQKNQQSFL